MNHKKNWLLLCGPSGCLFFILLFWIQGALRQGYSSLRFPVSSLSLGEFGWIQRGSFLISGLLLNAFSIGLRKTILFLNRPIGIPRMIGAVGLGLMGAGFFSTDPVYGYPETAPVALHEYSWQGQLHVLSSLFVFVCLPIACFKSRRFFRSIGRQSWANYSLFSAVSLLFFLILSGAGFKQLWGLVQIAGLLQRLSIISGFAWIIWLGFVLRRPSPSLENPGADSMARK